MADDLGISWGRRNQRPQTPQPAAGPNLNLNYTDPLTLDSLFPRLLEPRGNEGTQDQVFRLLRDQLGFARSRYNRLGTLSGATSKDLAAAVDPLRQQLGRLDADENLLSGLTDQLVNSSLGSTAGASMAAVNAARLADPRFGGGGVAAQVAARGAVDAAGASSAALSSAIVQGRLGEATYRQNLQRDRAGLATALSTVLQQQAGLLEERGQLGVGMETELASLLGGAMNVYGGITAGRQQDSGKKPSIFGLI